MFRPWRSPLGVPSRLRVAAVSPFERATRDVVSTSLFNANLLRHRAVTLVIGTSANFVAVGALSGESPLSLDIPNGGGFSATHALTGTVGFGIETAGEMFAFQPFEGASSISLAAGDDGTFAAVASLQAGPTFLSINIAFSPMFALHALGGGDTLSLLSATDMAAVAPFDGPLSLDLSAAVSAMAAIGQLAGEVSLDTLAEADLTGLHPLEGETAISLMMFIRFGVPFGGEATFTVFAQPATINQISALTTSIRIMRSRLQGNITRLRPVMRTNFDGTMAPEWKFGKDGPSILHGTIPPVDVIGADGDLYVEIAGTTKLWAKSDGRWASASDAALAHTPQNLDDGNLTRVGPRANYVGVPLVATPHTVGISGGYTGRRLLIKDEGGNAGAMPITVLTLDDTLIDGERAVAVATNHGFVDLVFSSGAWQVVGR